MIRFTRTFSLRVKGFNSLQIAQLPTSCKLIVKNFSTASTQSEVNEDDEKKNNKTDFRVISTAIANISSLQQELSSDQNVGVIVPQSQRRLTSYKNESVNRLSEILNYNYEGAVDKLQSFSHAQALQVLKILSHKGDRPIKLLKLLSKKICDKSENLSVIECSQLLFYLATLSFKDEILIEEIASVILRKHSQFSSGILPASILHSFGILKFKNFELFELLLKLVYADQGPKKLKLHVMALVAMAKIDYKSPGIAVLLNELMKCNDTDFHDTKSYLDFVWACVLLNHLPEKHLATVLSQKFVNQLMIVEGQSVLKDVTILKLLNINAAATTLLPSYKGPYWNKQYKKPELSKAKYQLLLSVVDGLSHIFPKKELLKVNVDTGAGFILEVQCCVDFQGKPLQPKTKKDKCHKIGIILLDYNDYCLDQEHTVCGLCNFKQRVLKAKGYKLMIIPYTEYDNSLKLFQKVQYLHKKLMDVCRN